LDQATFDSTFLVEVPEPARGLLLVLGMVVGLAGSRRTRV
jgi:hypothetical protein